MAAYGFEDHCWQDVVSAEDIELYKHYQRELYVGRRPAILAIDLYNSAYQGGPLPVHEVAKEFPSACGEYAWNAIEQAAVRDGASPRLPRRLHDRRGPA